MTKRWDRYITATIAVGLTTVFCFFVLEPQQRRLAELRASVAAIQAQLAQRRGEVGELPDIETKIKRADALLADFRTRIPATADVGDFVEDVSAIAERLGLSNRNIVPMAPKDCGPVTALPIRISFEAGFPAVFDFLREIERLPRVARVTELVLERAPVEGELTVLHEGRLRTELTAQVFYEATPAGSPT